jgi:putative membrane protein
MVRRLALGVLAAPFVLRSMPVQAQTGTQMVSVNAVQAQTLGGMAFALVTAQLAERQAENPSARLFGQLEAEEQTAFTLARRQVGLPIPTPELMNAQQRTMAAQLQSLSGAQFDRMFIQGQMLGHRELLTLHQQIAQSPTNAQEQALAIVAVPAIRTHLTVLEGIQRSMGG